MTTRSSRRGEEGLTLAETLIAVTIMTVGLLGAAQFMALTMQVQVAARETTSATRLASAKTEELMKANFGTNPSVQISGAPDPLDLNVQNYFDFPDPSYTRRWRVEAGPTDTTRLVTVRLIPRQTDVRMAKVVELTTVIRQW
mgnify:CR=1 FL=1